MKPTKSKNNGDKAGKTRQYRGHIIISSILSSAVLCSAAGTANPVPPAIANASIEEEQVADRPTTELAASEVQAMGSNSDPAVSSPVKAMLGDEAVPSVSGSTQLLPAAVEETPNHHLAERKALFTRETSARQAGDGNTTFITSTKELQEPKPAEISAPAQINQPLPANTQLHPAVHQASALEPNSNRIAPQPAQLAQASTFPDVQGHWAQTFIEALAAQDIIRGFPDGTFRPDAPVTRAQYAALIRKAFARNTVRNPIQFVDVPITYWAYDAIQEAYQIGFLEGYPNSIFQPEQNIPRVQALVSLSNGLNLTAQADTRTVLSRYFQDAAQIPNYAVNSIAAATENSIVVNYPNVAFLNPNQIATRADVAAFIYQALVSSGELPALPPTNVATGYIVGYEAPIAQPPTPPTQSLEALQAEYLLTEPATIEVPIVGSVGAPGSSSGSPTAFGADWGRVFAGFGFQERTRYTDESDGSLSVGIGLGDAQRVVGVEVTAAALSLLGDDAFERGGISFKVHRLLPNDFAVAAGVENLIVWGDTDAGSSGYGVVSKMFRLRENTREPLSQLTLSLGLGGGRFRSEDAIEDDDGSINIFGSAGLRVLEPVSLIADWTGQDLNLGASIAPFRNFPLVITPAVADVTNNAGDGARFILGIGYNYAFPTNSRR